jgi:AcrR family transcriptional regulator
MNLFEEHKAERRARILKTARALIAERGYDGLTMRDLAEASRVSVPTLYNLFGSKDAILVAELETQAKEIAAHLPDGGDSFFARGMAAFEMGMLLVETAPDLYRAVMQMFLTSTATSALRRSSAESYVALMADLLREGQKTGEIEPWVDALVLARRMFAHYQLAMIEWARGEIDAETFRAATRFGMCVMLLGVARGTAHRRRGRASSRSGKVTSGRSRARKGGRS